MKNLSLTVFVFFIGITAFAQQNVLEAPEDSRPPNTSTIYENRNQDTDLGPTAPVELPPDSEQVFSFVEQMPMFEGGQEALMKFLVNNIRYPEAAVEQELQGKVFVEFVVYPNGELGKFIILRGVHSLLDKEALRVVKLTSGKWTPGRQNGKAVPVKFRLPVAFVLQ
jgi:TonB family protein